MIFLGILGGCSRESPEESGQIGGEIFVTFDHPGWPEQIDCSMTYDPVSGLTTGAGGGGSSGGITNSIRWNCSAEQKDNQFLCTVEINDVSYALNVLLSRPAERLFEDGVKIRGWFEPSRSNKAP
ncbi:MAG: hypothetical protein VCA73_08755 [Roseibacillus sp.]